MAWIFSMWIEAETQPQRAAIKAYFEGRVIEACGKQFPIVTFEGGMITVEGISQIGITSQADALEMTAIGHELYRLLQDAPQFRYALTGVEVDSWREMHELEEDPRDMLISGCVIHKDIYEHLGSPGEMVKFHGDYVWQPYEGEKWSGD